MIDQIYQVLQLRLAAKELRYSKIDEYVKFTFVFKHLAPQAKELGIEPDYYDPDTSYEEDARAYLNAFLDMTEHFEELIERLEQ
ncbi:MAG: hypothetical protein R3251_03370 [Candidatus Spechtbacterales bacterium]|nr:hypothetical protein [Candidatus Spechtbacterales bacterium]